MTLGDTFREATLAALSLSPERLAAVPDLPHVGAAALAIVLLAGLSEAAGESVVLFVNRVRPRRFVLSLLVSALILAFTYLFLAGSVHTVSRLLVDPEVRLPTVTTIVAVAFAPRMFGFLAFLPYFGQPIALALQGWSVLALLTCVRATQGATLAQALAAVVLGALLLVVVQRTVGRPFAYVARRLRWLTAGVELATPAEAVERLLEAAGEGAPAMEPRAVEEAAADAEPAEKAVR